MKLMYSIFIVLVTFVLPTVCHAESIKVDCKEYSRLTGDNYPCDIMTTLTVPKGQYETALRRAEVAACKDRVHAKYPGVDCQPMRLYDDKETDGHRCFNELAGCDSAEADKSQSKKEGQTVKLW